MKPCFLITHSECWYVQTPPVTQMQASTHLRELLLLQFPFLDAVVSRSTEQHVSLHSQTLDAIIMWRLKVMSWTYVSQSSLCHVKHLTGKETFVCIFDL